MTPPVLAILGSTTETQKLFTLAKDGKLPFHCKSIDSLKDKEEPMTYCNGQVITDLSGRSQKYIMGMGNLIDAQAISSYYQQAIPKTAFVVKANQKLLAGDWNLLSIEKSLPLVTKTTTKYELVKILQSLRVLYVGDLENIKFEEAKMLAQKSLHLVATINDLKIRIYLHPSSEETEVWTFSSDSKKLKVDLVSDTYELTSLLDPVGKIHQSFHVEKRGLSTSSLWDEIIKAESSLQNLTASDWKWVENV